MNYLLDASVVVKFLSASDETVFKKFSKLLREARDKKCVLNSSFLLPFEVCNALRYSWVEPEKTNIAINKFYKLPIIFFKITASQMEKITDVAYQNNTTVYDTSYHILAKTHGATFLTCDKEYYKKAKELGNIELLD